MSDYGLIYTIPFAAQDDTPCTVQVEKEGYTGSSTELVAGETPFTVEIGGEEFLYTPTRFSTAKLCVVGSDYLQELFSTQYRQYRVLFKYGGNVVWRGFIKPEMYTQDYSSETFGLEVECQSAMSVLEYVDYTLSGASVSFVSFWDLLWQCVEQSQGGYTEVYIPHVYGSSQQAYAGGEENVLESLTVSEQNFFDEDGKAMTLKEVLEELCKFMNWTCADWNGSLWFVDIDHAGAYRKYTSKSASPSVVSLPQPLSVQDIGFAGTGHSLDILGGYNKVTVKCSNYPVGEKSWSTDFEELEELGEEDFTKDNDVKHFVYLAPSGFVMKQYTRSGTTFSEVTDLSAYKGNPNALNALYGAIPAKYCDYQMEQVNGQWRPSISNYSYSYEMRVRTADNNSSSAVQLPDGMTLLEVHLPTAAYSNGILCINGTLELSRENDLGFPDDYALPLHSRYQDRTFLLRIGDMGYNGTGFVKGHSGIFTITLERESEEDMDFSIPNGKMLTDPYDGAEGYVVRLPGILAGELVFGVLSKHVWYNGSGLEEYVRETGCFWKDLSIGFYKQNGTGDSSSQGNGYDRIYENVINDDYINELDEIEIKMSSYNDDGACYSKVMLGDDFLTDNLYNSILGKAKRPEEMLITRIINHYRHPNVKLTQPLDFAGQFSPVSRLNDTFMPGKAFIPTGGTIDFRRGKFECVMIEI